MLLTHECAGVPRCCGLGDRAKGSREPFQRPALGAFDAGTQEPLSL